LAITEVQTAGRGFSPTDDRILLALIFHRLTGGHFDAICPGVSAESGGYRKAGAFTTSGWRWPCN
jgi:hypothetical protein